MTKVERLGITLTIVRTIGAPRQSWGAPTSHLLSVFTRSALGEIRLTPARAPHCKGEEQECTSPSSQSKDSVR